MKYVLLTDIYWVLEGGSYDGLYEFMVKGHDLNDDKVISFINNELNDIDDFLRVEKIISKEQMAYSSSRFFEGQDAKDEGHDSWVNFFSYDDYKKGHGKCTKYVVTLSKGDE